MRVIRCPRCDEPLPGFASFCTACGENLLPSPTSTTVRLSKRPAALKVPRFFAIDENSEATATALSTELSPTEMLRRAQQLSGFSSQRDQNETLVAPDLLDSFESDEKADSLEDPEDAESIEESRRNTNWHKIVDSRPHRTPSAPRLPVPPTPRTPLSAEYLLTPRPRLWRRPRPSFFFVSSILVLVTIVIGGLFGVVVTLGRGALAQKSPTHNEMTLQVTPAAVALGALITVRGTNFSPHGHIGLTRDTTIPIFDTDNKTIIQADRKGFFTDTIIVGPEWQAGSHIIRAEDALLHKVASFTIIVTGHSPSLRPAHLLISAQTLDLGSGDQATNSTKTIVLTNAGGGQISWQGTSTQPWLLLSPQSGTFASGENVQVTIAADRSNLQPGSYAAEIILTSNAGQVTLPVKMKTTLLQPGHAPVLQLTPAVLSFTGTDGGKNPAAQVVTVSNPGVLPLQWNTSISGGNGWLSISPQTGSVVNGGSQAIVIRVNISSQLPGTYNAVLTFTGQGSGVVKDSPQNVYISLTIVPQCALQISPGFLSFTGVYLQPGPAPKIISLNVTQGCTTSLHWGAVVTTNNGGSWLSIGSTSGTTPSYPTIRVNNAGLQPGTYTGLVIFNVTEGTHTMPVTFTLGQPTTPIMTTTPATMAFSGVIGQPDPSAQTMTITNTGGGVLNWQVTVSTNFGGAWLVVASTSGSLSAQQSGSVSVTATLLPGLTPNTYTGLVTITGTDGSGHTAIGSPQVIPVNFTVLPACTIAVSPLALNFTGVAGQPNPRTQPVKITASGTCSQPLKWTATITNGTWLTVKPTSGTISLTTSAKTNIGVALSGLSPNTYTGQVTVTAVNAVTHQSIGTPQNITVTLTVQAPCTLQAPSVSSETFSAEAGTNPNPASQTFTIGIFGACSGKITITPTVTQSWLAITPSSVITGGNTTFKVTVTSASLVAGSYSDTISLAAVNGGGITINGSPQTVQVALSVLAPPVLTVSPSQLTINVTTGTTSQPISIGNSGGEPLNWSTTLGSGAPTFTSLSAAAGSGLVGGANTSVNVIVDATGVTGGSSFTTTVTVSATDPVTGNVVSGSPVTVGITINIAPPALQLSATGLTYTTTAGVNPTAQSIILTNTGGDGLTWTAGTASQSWLTPGLTSGSDASGATSTIPFNVDVTGLASGTYTATVVITPSVGSAVTVTVTLTVT